MKFSYEDLISGEAIFVNGIGHFRSPILRELSPSGKINGWTYQLYLNILSWDKQSYIDFMKLTTGRTLKKLEENEKITVFDTMTILEQPRKLLQEAMAFFMLESLQWDNKKLQFVTLSDNGSAVGTINRENFEEVRDMMLQVNYISVGEAAAPVEHSSQKAKELWERSQKYLKEQSAKSNKDKSYSFGNIVSKLCAAATGYTLFNIYDLTIFQLYDQFFQYGYLRAMNLNEMAFSNHGGEKFDMQAWLKPILKI